jgi:hypothetical protein
VVEVLKFATEYGALGVAVLLLVIALRTIYGNSRADREEHDKQIACKDKELARLYGVLADEQRARVDDAKRFTEVALQLQSDVISSVASIERASSENAKLCEFVEKLVSTVESLLEEQRRTGFPRRR